MFDDNLKTGILKPSTGGFKSSNPLVKTGWNLVDKFINTTYNAPKGSTKKNTGGHEPRPVFTKETTKNNNIMQNANPLKSTVESVNQTIQSAKESVNKVLGRVEYSSLFKVLLYCGAIVVGGYFIYKRFFKNKHKSKLV